MTGLPLENKQLLQTTLTRVFEINSIVCSSQERAMKSGKLASGLPLWHQIYCVHTHCFFWNSFLGLLLISLKQEAGEYRESLLFFLVEGSAGAGRVVRVTVCLREGVGDQKSKVHLPSKGWPEGNLDHFITGPAAVRKSMASTWAGTRLRRHGDGYYWGPRSNGRTCMWNAFR